MNKLCSNSKNDLNDQSGLTFLFTKEVTVKISLQNCLASQTVQKGKYY